jgi:ADP-heptose:LPS heptosyltransferase
MERDVRITPRVDQHLGGNWRASLAGRELHRRDAPHPRAVAECDDARDRIAVGARSCRADRACGDGEVVPTPSIREALALVATADFVFTPDTSIAHAVSALQRPSVAIYGKGSRARWGLYGAPGESVEHTSPDRSLVELPVERVLAAIDRVWDEFVD